MGLLLPPRVEREILQEKWVERRREHRAMLNQLLDFDDPVCREWQPELRKLDPYLRLGRAHGLAHAPGYPVRAGFYHWVRDNETAPATITPITGPDGEWSEPDSRLLEQLKANDLQDPRVYGRLLARGVEQEREAELNQARATVERQTELAERVKAATETSISMSRDAPWSQNVAGARGRKRAA